MLRKRIAAALLVVLLAAVLTPALAYETKKATLYYNGISILLDGEYLTPKDVAGNIVNPFVIDGTTYLPIRAIASALGLEVEWEQETQTIRLTSGAAVDRLKGVANVIPPYTADVTLKYPGIKIILDGQTLVPKDVNGKVVDPFVIGGTTYMPIRAISSALGLAVDWDGSTKTVLLYSAETVLGSVTGRTYENPWFGVRFNAPESWTVQTTQLTAAAAALQKDRQATLPFAAAPDGTGVQFGFLFLPEVTATAVWTDTSYQHLGQSILGGIQQQDLNLPYPDASISADTSGGNAYGLYTIWYNHNRKPDPADPALLPCAKVDSLEAIRTIL